MGPMRHPIIEFVLMVKAKPPLVSLTPLLLSVASLLLAPALALAVIFTSFGDARAAQADRPDANALFQSLVNAKPKSYSHPKMRDAFVAGVQEIIEAIEQSKPVTLTAHGYPAEFSDFNREYGLPSNNLGCVVFGFEDGLKNTGRKTALNWYAERGLFPVNSLKSQIAQSVPLDLDWFALAEGDPNPADTSPLLYLSAADVDNAKLGYSVRSIMWRHDGKCEQVRYSLPIAPAPLSKWAYDARTQTYFIDAVHSRIPPDSINFYSVDDDAPYSPKQVQPTDLAWQKIQPNATEGVVAVKKEDGFYLYLKKEKGDQQLSAFPIEHRWQDLFWAFDAKRKLVWIKNREPIMTRVILQLHAPSHKVMQVFEPPKELNLKSAKPPAPSATDSESASAKNNIVGKYLGPHQP